MVEKKGITFLSVIPVRKEASDRSELVTQLLFGETYSVLHLEEKWLKIKMDLDGYEGYIDRKQYMVLDEEMAGEYESDDAVLIVYDFKTRIEEFGTIHLSPGSVVPQTWMEGHQQFTRPFSNTVDIKQLLEDANSFLGTPYLWGGRSVFGIDCSGLIQVLFKMNGLKTPRDAWQQAEIGEAIEFGKQLAGDLAFFKNEKGRITHVGLITSENTILHASGWVKENELTAKGIVDDEGSISHQFHSIRRIQ